MDLTFNILLIIHLAAFGLAITTTIAAPLIGSRIAAAPPDARPLLGGIGKRLSINARIAFGLLLITGVAMVYVRYGGFEGQSVWFFIKMGLVVVVLIAMIIGILAKPGTISPQVMGWITRLAMAGIVISAVMAFN
jgi:protoporphyrinogen IX oxidase